MEPTETFKLRSQLTFMRILPILLVLTLLSLSCSSSRDTSKLTNSSVIKIPESSIAVVDRNGANILFVIYEVFQNDKKEMQANVYKQVIKEGKLKQRKDISISNDDVFTIELLANDGSLIQKTVTENPLNNIIRFPNDNGACSEEEVNWLKKEIVFRSQVDATAGLLLLKYQNKTLHQLKIN